MLFRSQSTWNPQGHPGELGAATRQGPAHGRRRLAGEPGANGTGPPEGRAGADEDGAVTSMHQRPGFGCGGWLGGRSERCEENAAQRRERSAGQFVKRASFTRSVKETKPAIPGHGNGPLSLTSGAGGLKVNGSRVPGDEGAALIAVLRADRQGAQAPQSGGVLRGCQRGGCRRAPREGWTPVRGETLGL